jgi:hypothetical protein
MDGAPLRAGAARVGSTKVCESVPTVNGAVAGASVVVVVVDDDVVELSARRLVRRSRARMLRSPSGAMRRNLRPCAAAVVDGEDDAWSAPLLLQPTATRASATSATVVLMHRVPVTTPRCRRQQ